MKFAYLLMGDFDSRRDRASFPHADVTMIGVRDLADACRTAKELQQDGVTCIELCGAFGADGAQQVIAATGRQVAVAYAVHLPAQDELFRQIFGG